MVEGRSVLLKVGVEVEVVGDKDKVDWDKVVEGTLADLDMEAEGTLADWDKEGT